MIRVGDYVTFDGANDGDSPPDHVEVDEVYEVLDVYESGTIIVRVGGGDNEGQVELYEGEYSLYRSKSRKPAKVRALPSWF